MRKTLNERRGEPRVEVNHRFEGMERYIPAYVTNVSRSGAFIRTAERLRAGMTVQLNHTIVVDGIATLRGTARVVRVSRQPLGVGVAFESLTAESQRVVEALVCASAAPAAAVA